MKYFDVFGRDISLLYKGNSKHRTCFGGILTIAIIIVLIVRLEYVISSIKDRNSPNLLIQERSAKNTQNFVINSKTFTLAIGVTSDSKEYIIDPKLFSIESFITTKKQIYNNATQTYKFQEKKVSLSLEECTSDHFSVEGAKDYLRNSKYKNHFCLPLNQDINIQGDIMSDTFSTLTVQLKKCTLSCSSNDDLDLFLKTHYIEIYFSDISMKQDLKSTPYTHYGKQLSSYTSSLLSKSLNIYLRNNEIESDFGWVGTDIVSESIPSFSYTEEHLLDSSKNNFFNRFVIQFDQKENYYQRSYQKLLSVLVELGSIAFVLYCLLFPIGSFYSKYHLYSHLVNKIYSFHEVKQQIKTSNELQLSKTYNEKGNGQINQGLKDIVLDEKDSFRFPANSQHLQIYKKKESIFANGVGAFPIEVKSILKQRDSQYQLSQVGEGESQTTLSDKSEELKQLLEQIKEYQQRNEVIEKSKSLKSSKTQREKMVEGLKSRQIKDNIQKTIKQISIVIRRSSNKLKFNLLDYSKSVLSVFKKYKTQKDLIDKSIEQLDQNLDLEFIMNKFIELEFLKKTVLNVDQIALWQFLPKPSINYSIIDQKIVLLDPILTKANKYQADYEKLKNGINAYKNIINQEKVQRTDKNLFKQLDHHYLSLFKDQADKKKSVSIQNLQTQQEKYPLQSQQTQNQDQPQQQQQSQQQQQQQQEISVQQSQQNNIQQVAPIIMLHKSPNLSSRNSFNVKISSPPFSSSSLRQNMLQMQSTLNLDHQQQLTRYTYPYLSTRNGITTPVQKVLQSIEQDLSNEFIIEMEKDSTTQSGIEENVVFHSNQGCIQLPHQSSQYNPKRL